MSPARRTRHGTGRWLLGSGTRRNRAPRPSSTTPRSNVTSRIGRRRSRTGRARLPGGSPWATLSGLGVTGDVDPTLLHIGTTITGAFMIPPAISDARHSAVRRFGPEAFPFGRGGQHQERHALAVSGRRGPPAWSSSRSTSSGFHGPIGEIAAHAAPADDVVEIHILTVTVGFCHGQLP